MRRAEEKAKQRTEEYKKEQEEYLRELEEMPDMTATEELVEYSSGFKVRKKLNKYLKLQYFDCCSYKEH